MSAFENIAIKDIVSGNDLIITAAGAAKVDGSGVVQPVSGTVTIVPSGTQDVNIVSSIALSVTGPLTDAQLRASPVPVDTELPAAAALADNTANPTAPAVGAFTMIWDGANWDRAPGDQTDGLLVNLGANNDVSLNAGTNYVGKVRLTDGVTDAEVVPLGGYNAQAVAIVDGSGNQITSFGGGSQYTEDDALPSEPIGNVLIGRRKDTLIQTEVSADGDAIALNATERGELMVVLSDMSEILQRSLQSIEYLPMLITNGSKMRVDLAESGTLSALTSVSSVASVSQITGYGSGTPVVDGGLFFITQSVDVFYSWRNKIFT